MTVAEFKAFYFDSVWKAVKETVTKAEETLIRIYVQSQVLGRNT